MLELVGVVLEDPELCGQLLLHLLGRAVHRLVRPGVVGPGLVAPLPALARHARGQVLLQRLDAPVHHGRGVAVLGPLRAARLQVCRDHEVPVVPCQLPHGALGGPADRLGVLVLQRFHSTDLSDSRVKTEIAEADVAELLQLFDPVEAKQYKRPDMNKDLRLGFASDDFAGTKWKNLTGTTARRWSRSTTRTSPACCGGCARLPGPAGQGGSLAASGGRRTSSVQLCEQASSF